MIYLQTIYVKSSLHMKDLTFYFVVIQKVYIFANIINKIYNHGQYL